ncbi:GGDEF domain-containing protein [Vibrio sp. LaRot3]|uniref:GGDEF domain-containing protein n=1 Tax=Vibrio sp. LaRot3 TaxID=2998829 RepID=UPI0022CE1CC2|nr:GGDEF domain-containing protein [Vibrio sp. LaRot3]MDA0147796.1 GGDEF domain-containing protein [Vibrio sp. LaRot3]
MINVVKRLSINQMLLVSHLLLALLIISGLSMARFDSEWHRQIDYSASLAKQSLHPHVNTFSTAVSGINYANLTMPQTIEALAVVDDILFVDIQGTSDYSGQSVHVRYLPIDKEVWRADVEPQEIASAQQRVEKLTALLKEVESFNTIKTRKLSYLLNKAQAEYQALTQSYSQEKTATVKWQKPTSTDDNYFLQEQGYLLHVLLPLRNKNGGELWAVIDASKLADIKLTLMKDIVFEALLAVVLSVAVVLWATHWVVAPLKNLAKSMSGEETYSNIKDLPELTRSDEIGQLAQAYKGLLLKIDRQMNSLRAKSDADPLTGLGSRYKYARTSQPYIKNNVLQGKYVGLMIIDIDNFKAFNDIYGHMQGDAALATVACHVQKALTNVDMAFRYGGEEFVVLCARHDRNELERVGELVRRAIEDLNVEHVGNGQHGKITISIGGALAQKEALGKEESTYEHLVESLFATADKALYECKSAGRNRVAWASVFSADLAVEPA